MYTYIKPKKSYCLANKSIFLITNLSKSQFSKYLMMVHFSTRFYMPAVHLLEVDRFWGFTEVNLPYDIV